MSQTEFNKKDLYSKLLAEAVTKGLSHVFVLNEFKRNKWNLNENQAVELANTFDTNVKDIMNQAMDLNILNVNNKLKKELIKLRKNEQHV